MSKLSFALSILVLPFAFHSIRAQEAAQSAETKAGTAAVSGRVTLKGEPARGVMIILDGQNRFPSNAHSARTDENGRFRFTGVAAGTYSVHAIAPGYASTEDKSHSALEKSLNVAEGEKVENIDFEIRRGGVIAGRITDSQGRPVIEETITLSKRNRNNQPEYYSTYTRSNDMYRTDDRGVYRIYGLPEGRYLVSVGYAQTRGEKRITSRRAIYPRVFYPNVIGESEAKAIEVSEGSEATNVDITVSDPKETRDISGHVVDAGTGKPVPDLDVVTIAISSDGRGMGISSGDKVQSGSDGAFRMFGLMPGKYHLLVPGSGENRGYVSDELRIIDISEDHATGIELKVRRGTASISGVVVIEGTSDPKVLAKLSQINVKADVGLADQSIWGSVGSLPVEVNADGSFRISDLHAGKANIRASSPTDMRGITLARIERNGTPALEGIEIDAGEQVTGVRVVLLYGALTLRGAMKVVGGTLPAGYGFHAGAFRTDQNAQYRQWVFLDERGQFAFENLAPGEYEISIYPFPQGVPRFDFEFRDLVSSFKQKVVVGNDNQQPFTLVVDLSRKGGDK
jgi:5-hydroxyisourate hydrolase-like protein (transthyretin family)